MKTMTITKKPEELLTSSEEKNKKQIRARTGLEALFRKELSDQLLSKRCVILMILVYATCFASLYGSVNGLSEDSVTEYLFLTLFSTSSNSIPSFMSFIALLGPFVGLSMGFDAINSERSNGTLNRLVSQPIYRDSIIIGKFLAGCAVIVMMVFSMGILVGAVGVLVTGLLPSFEEAVRILIYLGFTCVYIAFWLALSMLFSVFCRHSATSALAVIALWLFFTIFMSLVADIIANLIYPVNSQYDMIVNSMSNYTCELNLNRLSPYYLYSEAVSTIMNPSVRSVNVVTVQQLDGAISGYLSLGQSVLLVWPHLTGLLALMLASFAGGYVGFMKQEVRSA